MSGIHIPERCGVILLPDVSLFPHGGMPLHIFEPRYRAMLEDALEHESWMFAVGRLRRKESPDFADCVAPIGTIGLVRASRETEDGTFNVLLHGVFRVRFLEWHDDKPYPSASIVPVPVHFPANAKPDAAVKTLRGAVEDALEKVPEEVRSAVIQMLDRATDPIVLTDIVAQQFIHDPKMRTRIFELDSAAERIPWICDYLAKMTRDG